MAVIREQISPWTLPTLVAPYFPAHEGLRHCHELPDAARFCFVCGRDILDATEESGARRPSADTPAALRARLATTLEGQYRVRDVLGAGGMGVVFLADDLSLGRPVAIKVLPTELSVDKNVVARFRREAKTAASLDHPGIIPVLSVESKQGLTTSAEVRRGTLEAVCGKATLPIRCDTSAARYAAAALGQAHQTIRASRFKPANIMLGMAIAYPDGLWHLEVSTTSASDHSGLLTDLVCRRNAHYHGGRAGSGQAVDGRTDQYALGVVGFEMLAGCVPFDDVTPHAIIQRHINAPPPDLASLRPDAPAPLIAAIGRALSKAPSNRFATMEAFGTSLAGTASRATANVEFAVPVANALETAHVAERTPSRQKRRRRRKYAPWIAVVVLLVSGIGAAAAWVSAGRGAPKPSAERSSATPKSKTAAAASSRERK